MKKIAILLTSIILSVSLFLIIKPAISKADELDDINKELSQLKDDLNKSIAATKPVESELKSMQDQITRIKNRVSFVERDIVNKKREIDNGYKKLADKEKILYQAIRSYYIKSYYDSPLLILFSLENASDVTQALAYQRAKTNQDKQVITNIALSIIDLEKKKVNLEQEQKDLATAKVSLDEQISKLDKIVAGAKSYQAGISGKIAQLSEKQQSLVAAKLGSIYVPRSADTSASGCSSDIGKDPGFGPKFGFFSYGAPHGNGMNQYGAFGRAKAGQNEEEILQAYYPSMSLNKSYNQSIQISTTTGWSGSIEDYVKRIYEVPNSWGDQGGMATLKAQAVAARTYALKVTNNGSSQICTSESCQVFKSDPKGGNWETAVNATAGWVLMDGGNPGFTQYASTHGGYIKNLNKFDGSGGNPSNFGELNSRAYDRESPWFYCDWGSRSQYNGTAWLKTSEVADIANVIMLAQRDSSTGVHLSQTDKGIPDTWDAERVKSELRNRGGSPLNNVSSVSIGADFGSGITGSVSISGDGGSVSFGGSEWKDWFNLRAPANIQIKSRLYNVEQ